MLERILAYADNRGLQSEPGFATKRVRWAIACDKEGRFTSVLPLSDGSKARDFSFCPHLAQNELIAGGETRSQFLIESLQTVVLYLKDGASEKEISKAREKHNYFIALLEMAGEQMPALNCAARMLQDEEQLNLIHNELTCHTPAPKPTDTATLWIEGENPLENKVWHDWWRNYRALLHSDSGSNKSRENVVKMRCMLTGESIKPASTHPKIKGLNAVGGLGTGDVVVGFDKASFQSYNLEKSTNAAVSEETAKRYVEALNHLIKNNSTKLGDVLVVHWYSHSVPDEEDGLAFLRTPETPAPGVESLPKKLLSDIKSGQRHDLVNNHYFALTLSGASGRVMVRRWMEGQFMDLVESVNAWFDDLDIIARDGDKRASFPKFLAVAGSLERDLSDVSPPLIIQLWEAAVTNGRIPCSAHAKALLRCHADIVKDNPASHARMGLIKAWHRRNRGDKEMKTYLNPEHPSPAYHCGRLLAVLARLQYRALGDVGAGIVQRYYGAASQTPSLTLGRLMSNAKNHLAKPDVPAPWFEDRIAEIMCQLKDTIPSTLDLEQQSLFALGYYQQLAALKGGKSNNEQTTDEI